VNAYKICFLASYWNLKHVESEKVVWWFIWCGFGMEYVCMMDGERYTDDTRGCIKTWCKDHHASVADDIVAVTQLN
jgi:hypothetical protein